MTAGCAQSEVAHGDASLRQFAPGDFAAASTEMAVDPIASGILGFYADEPSLWAALQSDRRNTFWIDVDGLERVGFVEIEVLEPGDRATFSIIIWAPFRGRGYAPRALRAVIVWLCAHTSATELVSDTEPNNAASIRTLERTGFERSKRTGDRVAFRLQLE